MPPSPSPSGPPFPENSAGWSAHPAKAHPAPAADVVKTRHDSPIPTAAPETAVICLTADTVRLRSGAGTGYAEVALLTSGQPVTLTGAFVVSPDMGIWQPVDAGIYSGYINARFLCEVTK